MTKRNQEIDVDAGDNLVPVGVIEVTPTGYEISHAYDPALQRLIDSGIIVAAEGAISWREGHLEHVARVYAADQRLAWRDYADDLTVALSADGGTFAALVDKARDESA
jgi:hypothetical protein